MERRFSASAEQLWNAWTDPLVVMQWFGSDPDGKVLEATLDVQPGGKFEVRFNNSDDAEHTCYGIYKEVQPYNGLSFSWAWKNEPGVESFVTIVLESLNNDTLMKFEHAHVGYASAHNYEQGWSDTFLKLARILNK